MFTKSKSEHKVVIIADDKVVAVLNNADCETPAFLRDSFDEKTFEEMKAYCRGELRRPKNHVENKDICLDNLQAVITVFICGKCGSGHTEDDFANWYRSEDIRNRRDELLELVNEALPETVVRGIIYEPRYLYMWHMSGALGAYLCPDCYEEYKKSGRDIVGFFENSDEYLATVYQEPYHVVAELNSAGDDIFKVYADENAARKVFVDTVAERIGLGVNKDEHMMSFKKNLRDKSFCRVSPYTRIYLREFNAPMTVESKLYLVIGYDDHDGIASISGYNSRRQAETGLYLKAREFAATYGDREILALDKEGILDRLNNSELCVNDEDGRYVVLSLYVAPFVG